MLFTLYYQASWSSIQQVLYLTLKSVGRKKKQKKKKTKLLSFFDTVTAFQLCRVSHVKILTVSMWFKRMNVNHEPVTWQWMTTQCSLAGRHFHSDVWEGIKGICRAGRETERKGMEKRILIFVQCFSFYDELLKNLAICTSWVHNLCDIPAVFIQ